jgi:hypothetical protein
MTTIMDTGPIAAGPGNCTVKVYSRDPPLIGWHFHPRTILCRSGVEHLVAKAKSVIAKIDDTVGGPSQFDKATIELLLSHAHRVGLMVSERPVGVFDCKGETPDDPFVVIIETRWLEPWRRLITARIGAAQKPGWIAPPDPPPCHPEKCHCLKTRRDPV